MVELKSKGIKEQIMSIIYAEMHHHDAFRVEELLNNYVREVVTELNERNSVDEGEKSFCECKTELDKWCCNNDDCQCSQNKIPK